MRPPAVLDAVNVCHYHRRVMQSPRMFMQSTKIFSLARCRSLAPEISTSRTATSDSILRCQARNADYVDGCPARGAALLELRSQGVFAPLSPPVASLPPGGYAPLTPRRLRRPRGLCPLQPPPPTSLLPEFSMGGMPRLPTPYIFIICVGDVWFCCICFGDGLLHRGVCPPSGCRCS